LKADVSTATLAKFAVTTNALMDQVVSVIPALMIRIVPATKVVVYHPGNTQNNACMEAVASAKGAY